MDGIVSTWRRSVVLNFWKKASLIEEFQQRFIYKKTSTTSLDNSAQDLEATKVAGPYRNHIDQIDKAHPSAWRQFHYLQPFSNPPYYLFVYVAKLLRGQDVHPTKSTSELGPGKMHAHVQPNADAFQTRETQGSEPLAVYSPNVTQHHMAERQEQQPETPSDDDEVVLFQGRRSKYRQVNCSHGRNQGLKYLPKVIHVYQAEGLTIPAFRMKHYLGIEAEQMLTRQQALCVEGSLNRRKLESIDGALELVYPIEAKMLARKIGKGHQGQMQHEILAQLGHIRIEFTDERIKLQQRLGQIEAQHEQLKAATQAYFSRGCVEEVSVATNSDAVSPVDGMHKISKGIETVLDLEQRYQRLFDFDDARQALVAFREIDSDYRRMYSDAVMWEDRQRYVDDTMRFRARKRREPVPELVKRNGRDEHESLPHEFSSHLELQDVVRRLPSTMYVSRKLSTRETSHGEYVDLEAQQVFTVDGQAILKMEYDHWWASRTESLRKQRIQARNTFWLKNMRLTREGFVWPDDEHAYIMTMNEDVADLFSSTPADYLPDIPSRDT